MGRYPHLVLHRRRWMVRLIVPVDVRPVIGQSVYKISTGETDEHRAVAKAAPIIATLKERIRVARASLKRPIEAKAEELAEAYRTRQSADPTLAQAFVLTDVIAFVLAQHGHSWADYGRHVREAGYDAHAGLRQLPNGTAAAAAVDVITSRSTPFLKYSMSGNPMQVSSRAAWTKPSPRSLSFPARSDNPSRLWKRNMSRHGLMP